MFPPSNNHCWSAPPSQVIRSRCFHPRQRHYRKSSIPSVCCTRFVSHRKLFHQSRMSLHSQLSPSVIACAIVRAPSSRVDDHRKPEPLAALCVNWKSSHPQREPHPSRFCLLVEPPSLLAEPPSCFSLAKPFLSHQS
ncbi:hypothetical protein E6C27_scaffold1220G00100 [Cucumis melo var. makuwa]|uniref:Uncharacterized protein n=1 Tax=Cucumis melo var. makuwa TaxID=1194695 RepID=A0A5A7SL42_CUCMM|nr:hypothetical protein E6C27_scaffold1220G00100 [Cucumis melo var. makuwa]